MAEQTEKTLNVLSIDAWRNDGLWSWNNWHKIATVPASIVELDNRKFIKAIREAGIISDNSKGKVAVEDDGYNRVIVAKGTGEPLYAVEYGSDNS